MRWPKIIDNAAEDVNATIRSGHLTREEAEEGRLISQKLNELNVALGNDAALQPIPDDGGSDIGDYNAELKALGNITWRNAPWLYTECYLYRLMHTFFALSQSNIWKKYDVFAGPKRQSSTASISGIVELVQWFRTINQNARDEIIETPEARKALMEEMIQISLWGNATDLSLLTTISIEELQSRQGKKARQNLKENVVDDDTDQVWDLLGPLPEKGGTREIHIVLDNAGFELLADLLLAVYLLSAGYANDIVLHGKAMGWFVSDVNAHDLEDLVEAFMTGNIFKEVQDDDRKALKQFGTELRTLLDNGQLRFEADPFWTSQHPFGRLPEVAPKLYEQLSRAELVIFKGDLNYRKLVFDGLWPKTTPFQQALGALGDAKRTNGLRILALRTCKADTCVGLTRPDQEEILHRESDGEWTRNGKYAVISYCNAKE